MGLRNNLGLIYTTLAAGGSFLCVVPKGTLEGELDRLKEDLQKIEFDWEAINVFENKDFDCVVASKESEGEVEEGEENE